LKKETLLEKETKHKKVIKPEEEALLEKETKPEEESNPEKETKLLAFTDVFLCERGTRLTRVNQMPGDIAYISSTKENNGIDDFINPPEDMAIYNNKLTLSNSGSVCYCYYHDYDFVASDHVTVIDIKDKNITLNLYIALYLKPIFESMRYKFNFGREISNSRLRKEKLKLPIDDEGNPDWEYMENYIKSLPYIDKIVKDKKSLELK
jgi:type I restriction enzyme M protein